MTTVGEKIGDTVVVVVANDHPPTNMAGEEEKVGGIWRLEVDDVKEIHIFAIANNLLDQISAFKQIYANPKLQYLLHNKKESDQYRSKGEDWRCMEVNYFQ